MAGIVIVGMQWGDEGKGKIVDFMTKQADGVARYQGGNNAGHTVVYGKQEFKFHLIPSGILYPKVQNFIGAGVVVNPQVLLSEIDQLKQKGIKPNLLISEKAHVIMPFHIMQDELADKAQGKLSAGSTHRGIAPVYSDKASRHGIRMIDLLDKAVFKEKLEYLTKIKQATLTHAYKSDIQLDEQEIFQQYLEYGNQLAPFIGDVSKQINTLLDQQKTVIFEGAQGTMLCLDHGLYPYGTSSNPIAGGACVGTGVGPTKITKVIGVAKAYTSRVGKGPVPTEIEGELGNQIREKGHEFGTTTGRPRRIGWLDLVTLNYSIRVSGVSEIALTKLDILSNLERIRVCTNYLCRGKKVVDQPASISVYSECTPEYKDFKSFGDISDITSYDSLPEEAKTYIKFIEAATKTPIKIISVGPERTQTILR
ncbi:MAG: adenylosuccinate synthase [Candidatus Woesearchaeota archaeon]